MKKLSVMFLVAVALSCTTLGVEATAWKEWYEGGLTNGSFYPVVTSSVVVTNGNNVVTNVTTTVTTNDAGIVYWYGSKANMDYCVSVKWDATLIMNHVKDQPAVAWFNYDYDFWNSPIGGVWNYLTASERKTWILSLAKVHPERQDILVYAVLELPLEIRNSSEFDSLFAKPVTLSKQDIQRRLDRFIVNEAVKSKQRIAWREADIVTLLNWMLLGGKIKHVFDIDTAKNMIKGQSAILAKRSLRAKGKSFVSRTKTNAKGVEVTVNPIEEEMQPLVDALNAPKLTGIESALAGLGVTTNMIVRDESVWADIATEKDAIFYGDKPAHPDLDGGIMLLLGPDGYNAWVKEFNEGK